MAYLHLRFAQAMSILRNSHLLYSSVLAGVNCLGMVSQSGH